MNTLTQIMYYAGTYGTLILTICFFIKGLRIAQKYEEQRWKEQWQQLIQRVGKTK